MDVKKRRGCNYTVSEKDTLLELIKKYQHIIENKETNAHIILKKRQAWDCVCKEYNAVAVKSVRTWQQLRHLYENLKQRSKKNVAKENRLQYNEKTKEAQKKASIDKKEITSTGGGSYTSVLTQQDAQILAMVAPQVQPLQNPFDDAAFYFGDTELISENIETILTVNDVNKDDSANTDNHQTLLSNDYIEQNSNKPHTITSDTKGIDLILLFINCALWNKLLIYIM
ncbi:unnamed protein product [Parnassius mnemosyne]|uniref:Regulatory protein zeste n=1 Tax=Parnassius mnemosyne TaxID=213953 RepID=A0AAV1L845_9NEOP